jgi:DNA-binding NarL/FixJ family response regulator
VINHVTHILTKLDLASRTQAALYAFRHGLVEAEPA